MEFIPLGLIATTATFAFNVSELIAKLRAAGDEFKDAVKHLNTTSMALSHLKYLFKSHPLPLLQMSAYRSQIQGYERTFSDMDAFFFKHRGLDSGLLYNQFNKRRQLMNGDLRRFINQISTLNNSLNFTATAYNCEVTNLIRDDVGEIKADIHSLLAELGGKEKESKAPVTQNIIMNINIQYVEAAKTQQSNECIDQDLVNIPTAESPDPRYLESTTSTTDTVEWDFDPLGFLLSTREAQEKTPQLNPLQTQTWADILVASPNIKKFLSRTLAN